MSYFNVRVYGLLTNDQQQLLLSDEQEYGVQFTKFPGGGVEIGEGIIDALKREFMEECYCSINVLNHFYTTDFYEKSSFNESQVISVYYFVKLTSALNLEFKEKPFDFEAREEPKQAFRWMNMSDLTEEVVTFATDKKVVSLLMEKYASRSM